MASVPCFLLIPTSRAIRSLRRYGRTGVRCGSGFDYCNASVELPGEVEWLERKYNGRGEPPSDHNDPRWPIKCEACGREFEERDEWQQNVDRLFERSDGGPPCVMREAPVGAMYWADWLSGSSCTSRFHQARGGGPHLMVVTPGGCWDIDAKSSNGDGWDRSGDPPDITAHPSIQTGQYHGWLRGGVLVEA